MATGPRGWTQWDQGDGSTVSKLGEGVEAVETIEHGRADEPAEPLAYEERLRMAQRIVQAMQAVGIDCELAKAASAH